MTTTSESVFSIELQACFNELKKHSLSYKLGSGQQTVGGDEVENPLDKQFSIILSKIDEIFDKTPKESEEYLKILSMKASIIYEKAKILLSESLLVPSKKNLEEALELIKYFWNDPKVAFLYMRIVNHLTYVLSRLGELEQAEELLLKAIEEGDKCSPEVFSTDDLFLNTKKNPSVCLSKLSRLTLNNMHMLSWIYAKLGETSKNIKMQHDILQKQFDFGESDVIRWAESCYRLAGMFITEKDWENTRYHLAAAESVLNPLEVSLAPNPEIYAVQADLARSWVFYGLQLFNYSRSPAIINPDIESSSTDILLENKPTKDAEKPLLTFQGMQIEIPVVPTSRIENLQQAKILFSVIHKWVKRARLYYTLRDFPLQYVNLCLDLSELYRFVSLFEEDIESQYAVQKKRYDTLETLSNILKEVRPNCYLAVNIELTKEIIEVQMEMMNLNLKRLHVPSPTAKVNSKEEVLVRKVNALKEVSGKLESLSSSLNSDINVEKIEIPEMNVDLDDKKTEKKGLED
ncbi:uncharacterized protein LOC115891003 isoform X2 [Sitophilus oryzae]|uniref:KIF-binding protein n=1 Tax=Sitophilus oryzae TaxID=7048 RepID=A0A6J2YVD6_SITOR|nr:uncharacterized protein LOC115891003 isoform X1 [Sitophilus oryzae]XP_030767247.1 uncharacterized protein LOC115891003 isoform X1 [Sitophilus oryzae]XP_030767248.1 uncharacterized protein LOC115891003 isoform X2 [Sitophilus oryzae]